jgi:NADPH:quinone reductase-like Zn-dependent oxidoreductase
MALRSLKRGLGGGIDGVAAEYFVCNEEEAVHLPAHFTFAQTAAGPNGFMPRYRWSFALRCPGEPLSQTDVMTTDDI